MNRRCDKIIVLGRLCGDALFLFAERSMPVPYICDPGHKKRTRTQARPHVFYSTIDKYHVRQFACRGSRQKMPDYHRSPTTRVLLDCRQAPCTTVWVRALPGKKTPDYHRSPTTRVLLDCRQAPCTTVCPRRLAAENDPWRFRQQSSRVISIPFWYLTSWLPRFL